jgi:ApbE superfamily uncharacterized protein (UPF0280 family)
MYQPRTYRHWVKDKELTAFSVTVRETDLYIRARSNLKSRAHKLVVEYRRTLEEYIERHPVFQTSLEPLAVADDAPQIVTDMAESAEKCGVGPMAAVAGAIAGAVGSELLAFSPEVIVENGGDIYLKSLSKRLIGIYAGSSPLSGKVRLEIKGEDTPLSVCTSSGTVGHSLSYGRADAVIVLSKSAALADAAATAIGNRILKPVDIAGGIEYARTIEGLKGLVIIQGEQIGVWGEVKLGEMAVEA